MPRRVRTISTDKPRQAKATPCTAAPYDFVRAALKSLFKQSNLRRHNFLARRAHRSFRLTHRRDYKRNLALPGYWSFTNQVRTLLMQHKWLFLKFTVLYSVAAGLIFGLMSQENYQAFRSLSESVFDGQLSDLSLNLAVFASILGGAFSPELTDTQQIYGGLLLLLAWLTLVWLLRQVMAGHKNIRLRDGLYFSGSPLLSTALLFMVVLVQLLPLVIALVAYAVATSGVSVLSIPAFATLFWFVEALLVILSLYWLSSSFVALIVVTLPGMYPLKALKIAGDLVAGRRLRILYRLAWLFLSVFFIWLVILLPVILVANIESLAPVPIIPFAVLLLGSFSIIWSSSYIYMLYRKLVDDASSPA